jgi:Fe-S-cluster containining protein
MTNLPEGTPAADVRAHGLSWFRQNLACPFLDNEICLVHADRPFPCRNHLALSEVRHCSEPESGKIRVMNPRFSLGTVMAILTSEFMAEEPLKLPLAALEDWVRLHPAYAERRFPAEALSVRFLALLEAFVLSSIPIVPV